MAIEEERIMRRVFRLARRGTGKVSPNPLVGAVITRGRTVVGQGYHEKAGLPHAEIHALRQAGTRARGGTLFLNLEPCCHTGKRTPPCTDAILKSGIRKVVVAMRDPNPKVNGRGISLLRNAGIEVREGVLSRDAEVLNEVFTRFIRTAVPFVALKVAATLDGKIATASGESRWITGKEAREFGHRLRNQYDAILVGKGTVRADDPELTARLAGRGGRNPVRVIVDEDLALPLTMKVFKIRPGDRVIVGTTRRSQKSKRDRLRRKGITVLLLPEKKEGADLRSLFRKLGKAGITSVLVEGGSRINGTVIRQELADKLYYLISLKLMGGTHSISSLGGPSPSSLSALPSLKHARVRKLSEDLLVEGYLK